MIGQHHRFNGHKFEQTPGDSEGQGNLACCSPWGCKESDIVTEQQQQSTLTAGGGVGGRFPLVDGLVRVLKAASITWLAPWQGCLLSSAGMAN